MNSIVIGCSLSMSIGGRKACMSHTVRVHMSAALDPPRRSQSPPQQTKEIIPILYDTPRSAYKYTFDNPCISYHMPSRIGFSYPSCHSGYLTHAIANKTAYKSSLSMSKRKQRETTSNQHNSARLASSPHVPPRGSLLPPLCIRKHGRRPQPATFLTAIRPSAYCARY